MDSCNLYICPTIYSSRSALGGGASSRNLNLFISKQWLEVSFSSGFHTCIDRTMVTADHHDSRVGDSDKN